MVDQEQQINSVTRTIYVNEPYQEQLLNGAYPELTDNLIPVTIEDGGTVKRASTLSTWYSYEKKQWANVVVLKDENEEYENNEVIPEGSIESYFVWIPKYSYQIWDLGNYPGFLKIENKVHEIQIKFGLENTVDDHISAEKQCRTPMNGSQGIAGGSGNCAVGDYMTHPAFLAFDSNGFWVGKFETGYEGATKTAEAQINSSEQDKIIIKPNVYSWRGITLGNAFQTSYEYLRNEESHMMKNTEWGAVAYFSQSQYGTCTNDQCSEVRVNNNSNYITGYAAKEEPTAGYNNKADIEGNHVEGTELHENGTNTKMYHTTEGHQASTTGNITGVYDMSGGAMEYVMGYATNPTNNDANNNITSLYPTFFTSNDWKKYYDNYTSTFNTQFNNRILGDATGEMGPFGIENDPDNNQHTKNSWYKDYGYFVDLYSSWFDRGGYWPDGTSAGVFAFSHFNGNNFSNTSFRIVLTP